MASVSGSRQFWGQMREMRKDVDAMFKQAVPRIQSIIIGASDDKGKLDPRQRERLLRESGQIVLNLFVGLDGRSAFGDDGVTALAPFPQLLNKWYVKVTVQAIEQNRNWMKRNIPADIFRFLGQGGIALIGEVDGNPYLQQPGESDEEFTKRIEDLRIFHPNPLQELDPTRQWVPMHKWNDPNGYQLSDRVWRAGEETRRKIDLMIAEAFRNGTSAIDLARRLEQFLLPSRANLRTDRPYGVNASYDAMRLARTEIARAANQAAFISAYTNPYVNQIDVARSNSGDPDCPICPKHATLTFGGGRLRPPYSIHSASIPVFHPHCQCYLVPVVTDNPVVVTQRLRAIIQAGRVPEAMTPANEDYAQRLLHRSLASLVAQYVGQVRLPGF